MTWSGQISLILLDSTMLKHLTIGFWHRAISCRSAKCQMLIAKVLINMMRAKDMKLAAVIGGIVILAVVGLVFWKQGGVPGAKEKNLVLFVDRGFSEKDKAIFDQQVADKQKEVDELAAKGERSLVKILQLGNLYYSVGNLEKSAGQYRDILSTNPQDPPALENLGQTLYEMHDYEGAAVSWQNAIDASPYEVTYLRLADLLVEKFPARNADVKLVLEHAIANLGQTYGIMIRLGEWYARSGQYDRAVSHYEVALQLSPKNDEARKTMEEYRKKMVEAQTKAAPAQ